MKDRYDVSITALAILTSSNKNFRPKPYVEIKQKKVNDQDLKAIK
jgi:hypothetical protein